MATKLRLRANRPRMQRFDRAVRELNAFLLVLAIGLAALDATCFIAFEMRHSLPSAGLSHADPSTAMAAHVQSLVALTPSKPAANTIGW
jgi:hypothetical protein